jgi:hypothetical protein
MALECRGAYIHRRQRNSNGWICERTGLVFSEKRYESVTSSRVTVEVCKLVALADANYSIYLSCLPSFLSSHSQDLLIIPKTITPSPIGGMLGVYAELYTGLV